MAGLEDDLKEFLVSWHASDVLRRAVTFAGNADRSDHSRYWQNLFKLHVVPPVVAKVINVEYEITRRRQDIGDCGPSLVDELNPVVVVRFGYAPVLAVFLEPMQMAIGPAYKGLEDVVETIQPEGVWNLDQPPDRRTNLLESDPELVNVKAGSLVSGFSFRLSSPWLSSHIIAVAAGGEGQYIAMDRIKPRQLATGCRRKESL